LDLVLIINVYHNVRVHHRCVVYKCVMVVAVSSTTTLACFFRCIADGTRNRGEHRIIIQGRALRVMMLQKPPPLSSIGTQTSSRRSSFLWSITESTRDGRQCIIPTVAAAAAAAVVRH
jgi:hypothetical protein